MKNHFEYFFISNEMACCLTDSAMRSLLATERFFRRSGTFFPCRDGVTVLEMYDLAVEDGQRPRERTDFVPNRNEFARPVGTTRQQALRSLRDNAPEIHRATCRQLTTSQRAMVAARIAQQESVPLIKDGDRGDYPHCHPLNEEGEMLTDEPSLGGSKINENPWFILKPPDVTNSKGG